MPDFRRWYRPGGTVFFTVVTYGRRSILCDPVARQCLRSAIRECRRRWPFNIDATVLLPDHTHAIWTLPPGDEDYPKRWAWIKREFTRTWLAAGGAETSVTGSQHRQRRRGVWQPRYWEHIIHDVHDFERLIRYIHFNPVKHGYAAAPIDWPYSSFHRYIRSGDFEPDWGRAPTADDLADIDLDIVEPDGLQIR